MALTASLGRWQMQRAGEKLARQAAMAEREALPPLTNAALPCGAEAWVRQTHRRVTLSGRWLPEHTWLLDNRAMGGRAGFYVVTALQLDGVPCGAKSVLVQRGWVPRNAQNRSQLPPFFTPSGPVIVSGRLLPEVSRSFSLGADLALATASGPRIVQNVDFAALPAQVGGAVMAGAVLQTVPETAPSASQASPEAGAFALLRDWPAPASDVGKHHAYAAQWFAMAATITGLYVWFQIVKPLRRRPR
ncbi:MAG: SURF1 family protein [Rubrivivax sp.]|nr:MAG: SURF1 family protein [Rubrivivax sp.]